MENLKLKHDSGQQNQFSYQTSTSSWSDVSDSYDLSEQFETIPQASLNFVKEGSISDEFCEATTSLPDRLVQSVDLGDPTYFPDFSRISKELKKERAAEAHSQSAAKGVGPLLDDTDQGVKIKTKLFSAWNNMKYGFSVKTKTNFRYDTPIWLLGRRYIRTPEEQKLLAQSGRVFLTSMELFKQDFISKVWLTYRKDFTALPNTYFTSDSGWGCMLRSSQMMLAQAFILHFMKLGRDWRWHSKQNHDDLVFHKQIIRFFADSSNEQYAFSIHQLVKHGLAAGKKPGDWYGPASVAHILKDAMAVASKSSPLLLQLCLYVAQDCTVYLQDIIDMCTQRPRSSSFSQNGEDEMMSMINEVWRSVIILVPVRLGGEGMNEVYIPCVQKLFQSPYCIGIVGGKPKHSLYFTGYQEDKLIYLDPHLCQDYVDVRQRDFPLQSFHCYSPKKMSFNKMDPSCTVGFYCKTRRDLEHFVVESQQMIAQVQYQGQYPMFVISQRRCKEVNLSPSPAYKTHSPKRNKDTPKPKKQTSTESEEFVFL